MPSVSAKQSKLMRAIAHGWRPPASSGISVPVGVAREFMQADMAKKKKTLADVVNKK